MAENNDFAVSAADLPADPRVLVVEVVARMRELLGRVRNNWGFEVTLARSAEEAWRLADGARPDIVLLDLNLPGEGGLEFFARLRERAPRAQGIVLTGFASVETARQAIHLDVVEFLSKPCPLGELEKALDRALRRLMPAAKPALIRAEAEATAAADRATAPPPASVPGRTLEEVEREHILATLARHGNNRTATAAELGISRRTLYYKLEEYQGERWKAKGER